MTVSFIDNLFDNAEGETDLRRRAIYMQTGDTYDYIATKNGGYELIQFPNFDPERHVRKEEIPSASS